MPSTLSKLSHYYEAIVAELRKSLDENVTIRDYQVFNASEVEGYEVYIDLSSFKVIERYNDGRTQMSGMVDIHCLVSNGFAEAALDALDLSGAIALFADRNKWGLKHNTRLPENISCQDGMYKPGEQGFYGRVVSFEQTIIFGDPQAPEQRAGTRFAINPKKPDQPDEYQRLP